MKLRFGLYGTSGHQIQLSLIDHPLAEVVAVADFPDKAAEDLKHQVPHLRVYETLAQLNEDQEVDAVSLCSSVRHTQWVDTIDCMNAGKHVYAEKPSAPSEEALDKILKTSAHTGKLFHEMAGSIFDQPFYAIRKAVLSGVIGEVVQVFAQKSYPYFDSRPQDEKTDGGLIGQCSIHAVRFVEHATNLQIESLDAVETLTGNPKEQDGGGLRMAATIMGRLSNGGLATVISNYCNPLGFGSWGNETLRIFGTEGIIEAVDGGKRTRLVVGKVDHGELEITDAPIWQDAVIENFLTGAPMPLTLEEELHPLRIVLRADLAAKNNMI